MQNVIDLSRQVKEMINRNNLQIKSLDAVPQDLLKDFVSGRRKAVLVYRSKIFERGIRPLDGTIIEIVDDELGTYLKPGEKVLLVLPSDDEKRYVLQCRAETVHIDRFRLSVLDPRFNARYSPSAPCHMKLFWLPDVTVMKLQAGALQLLRQVNGKEEDLLIEKDNEQVDADFKKMLTGQSVKARLLDISEGGMGVEIREGKSDAAENNLIYIDLCLAANEEEAEADASIDIKVLGIVRTCRRCEGGITVLHVMFLSRLESAPRFFPQKDGDN